MMSKAYKVIKDNTFPKPFDKVGTKIMLEEKKAKSFVEKKALEPLEAAREKAIKTKPKAASKTPKK